MTATSIRSRHPVRGAFSDCSTGNCDGYYETKGSAIFAFECVLAEYGLCFDRDDLIDVPGDYGHVMIGVWTVQPECAECAECVGQAYVTWHRMPSGRYEFVGYIA